MAKIAFSKLGLKVDQELKNIKFNEQDIEVKQYLSVNEKLKLITEVIELSDSGYNYSNPIKERVHTDICILKYYTNINFTQKQLEDMVKLYDACLSSGLIDLVLSNIPEAELKFLKDGIKQTIESFYTYKTSILGIIESLKEGYNTMDFDIQKLISEIKDPKALDVLKQIAPFMQD